MDLVQKNENRAFVARYLSLQAIFNDGNNVIYCCPGGVNLIEGQVEFSTSFEAGVSI